jgi:hypothetical protein
VPEQEILLPAEENERLERAAELVRLRAEVKELRQIAGAAAYVYGPEGCRNGDRECDEYVTADGNDTGIEWCSHVEHRYAAWTDVNRAQRLTDLVAELRRQVERAQQGAPVDMLQKVLDVIEDYDVWEARPDD